MEIKLQSLKLKNFKGVKSFALNLAGENAAVYGRNGAGKSTLADALSWLLFDKDATGNSKFSVKTLNSNGQELHNLEHEVEASIEVHGSAQTLRKTMAEKWVKRRGQSTPEFSGHETTYYIDDVPKKRGEYEEFVASIVREDVFRMLTSVTQFNAMKWQDRRALLLEVIGDITDADVIASDEDLARVPEVLGSHSHEDAVKVLKASRKKVADEIDGIGPRIDEVERSKPEKGTAVPPTCGKTYRELQDELQKLQNERAALLAGDTTSAREEVLKLKERMAREDEEYRAKTQEQQKERAILSAAIEQVESVIERCVAEIQRLEEANEGLRAEWTILDGAEAPASMCQTCGQALPEDQAEEIRAKFQVQKADKLKGIREAGIKNNSKIDELKSDIYELEAEYKEVVSGQSKTREEHDAITMTDAPDHTQVLKIIAEIEADMAKASTPDASKVDAKIEAVRADIQRVDDTASAVKRLADADKRIAELKSSQKALGKELDRIDDDLMLLEEFTRAKVGMLEASVAAKFSPLSFRLFETQINGGLRETCETLIPSPEGAMVPYSDANTGHKILAGLKIIEVLSEHYGVHAPVIVDNAESLTEPVPISSGTQIIRLVASDAHAELTVEVARETEVAA